MEFPNLGDHCAIRTCQTLDFLPFSCEHCHLTFCKDHFEPEKHECEPYSKEGEFKNLKDDELKTVAKTPCYQCKKKCPPIEMINCKECNSSFCFEHRLQEDHSCAKLMRKKQSLMAKNSKPVIVRQVKEVKVRGAKNDALKLKVAIMKLKQKAQGVQSIPETERIYFIINNKMNNSTHEYFLCKKWSVGRCVSYLADELKIQNNNHKEGAVKLGLKVDEGHDYLPLERSIEELMLKEQCSNGQQLIISYDEQNKASGLET